MTIDQLNKMIASEISRLPGLGAVAVGRRILHRRYVAYCSPPILLNDIYDTNYVIYKE